MRSVHFVVVCRVGGTTVALFSFVIGGLSKGRDPTAFHHRAHWVSSVSLPDLRGDRRRVWDRHIPGGDCQHFCCLQVGVNQEQLSGCNHRDCRVHQLLHHHAAECGKWLQGNQAEA